MAELQTIPARHGVATFVPAGQVIKIINTSGTQVIDTWAFALPAPDGKKGESKDDQEEAEQLKQSQPSAKSAPKKLKKGNDFPSQEDAEKATKDGLSLGEKAEKDAADAKAQKSGWSSYVPTSYVPSLGFGGNKKEKDAPKNETQQQKNSRTWGSYFPSGKGFSSYIPKQATDTVSQFASSHQRDPSKSYLEQLTDFSKTPVGAAGLKGFAAMTGSGYSGSLYAGYNAWNSMNAAHGQMEFMSMTHTHTATLHLRPQVNDTLVTNLREPVLTLIEDTSPGVHDTLIAACDPQRYRSLGVPKWEEHGSCAENLVLALKELNQRAGLKGAKAIGADVTINSVPQPLNLFMNVPWDDAGDLGFHAPKSRAGDYVRFKAERDVVVVLSACPQDVVDVNNRQQPADAQFIVEDDGEDVTSALKRTQQQPATKKAAATAPSRKKPIPRAQANGSTTTTSSTNSASKASTNAPTPVKKKNPVPSTKPASTPPQKKIPAQNATTKAPQSTPAQPVKQSTSTATARPKKKPIPPSVAASVSAQDDDSTTAAAAPVEKKKPRKLPPRAKPAAAT